MTATLTPLGYTTYDVMIDIDDVAMPWAETVHLACGQLGLHDGTKPWSSWHMWEDYGCPQADWEYAVERAVADGLYQHTEPFPYAAEAVRRLHWYGHRIHFVTARGFMANGNKIRQWTPEWLERFAFPYDTLTFAKDKVAAQAELGVEFDFAVDDGVHNVELLHAAGVPTWLHTAPHNQGFPFDRRVASLWEFANIVLSSTPLAQQKEAP